MRIMKLLHLVPDDKFTHAAFENFSKQAGVDCSWLVVASNELKYLKAENFKTISFKNTKLKEFKDYLSRFDFVIVHSLSEVHCKIIINNPHRYVWVGMGYDYYEYVERDVHIGFSKKVNFLEVGLKRAVRSVFKNANFDFPSENLKSEAISKVMFFAPVLPNEFFPVKKIFKNLEYIEWNYGSLAKSLTNDMSLKEGANSILLGNSSDSSNNHVQILDTLSELNMSGRRIVLPLNYGSKVYKKLFLRKLKKYQTLDLNVLNDFMPKDKYFDYISGCDVVIMNHVRQQAGANIAIALFMGAKVFLNKKSPFFDFYVNKGAILFSVEEISKSPKIIAERLCQDDVKRNREVVLSVSSQENTDRKTAGLIECLRSTVVESRGQEI